MVEQSNEKYEHELYKYTPEIKDAEAVGFTFVNENKTVLFPYNNVELKANEVKSSILYAGLCMSDSFHSRSKWGPTSYPVSPGHEIIAQVSEVGKDVTKFKVGEVVAFGTMRDCCGDCKYCKLQKEPLCVNPNGSSLFTYGKHWGGYSTCLVQPESHYFKIPSNLKIEKSAPLLCAGITVYNPIKEHVKPGMKCAVVGIGGLGHLAIQFLGKMGYDVVGVTTSASKEKLIKELGGSGFVNIKDKDSLKANANKFDFVINTSPVSSDIETVLNLVAPLGILCQVGVTDFSELFSFRSYQVVMKEVKVVGSLVGSRKLVEEMLQYCADNDVYPMVENFEFEDFDKALDKMENGKPIFRCQVDCGKFSKKHNIFK